jgi:hypothetical protein
MPILGPDRLSAHSHEGAFMVNTSTSETSRFYPPKDLLAEAKRQKPKPSSDRFQVEGWRRSWLTKLSEMLIGKD